MKTKAIQLKIPEEVNKQLRIAAINAGLTLTEYCIKVLTEHTQEKVA